MTAGRGVSSIDRILLAIDASVQGEEVLETAFETAALLEARLLALFVEDVNLVRLAGLPFAKELDRASGTVRGLDANGMKHALQADAQRFQKRLTEASERRKVSVSMKVVRGRCTSAAMEMAGKGDVVILSNLPRASSLAAGTAAPGRMARRTLMTWPVWAVYDGSPEAERGLALGAGLAQRFHSELVVFVAQGQEQLADDKLAELARENPGTRYRLQALENITLQRSPGQACAVLVAPRDMADQGLIPDSLKCLRLLV